MRPQDVVQMFLLGAIVLAFSGDAHSQEIAVEPEAGIGIPYHDGSVIDAHRELIGRTVPFLQTLVGRKLQYFDGMSVRILEIERRDAGSILVPVGKALRPGGGVRDLVLPQQTVGLVHVADDDGNMLEPAVVAARINRDRPPFRGEVFGEFDGFISQPHSYNPHPKPEDTREVLVVVTRYFDV